MVLVPNEPSRKTGSRNPSATKAFSTSSTSALCVTWPSGSSRIDVRRLLHPGQVDDRRVGRKSVHVATATFRGQVVDEGGDVVAEAVHVEGSRSGLRDVYSLWPQTLVLGSTCMASTSAATPSLIESSAAGPPLPVVWSVSTPIANRLPHSAGILPKP